MKPDDAALDEIADPYFREIVSTVIVDSPQEARWHDIVVRAALRKDASRTM